MAELDIQRKSGSNWLVWLLVLAVVALLAWWLIGLMGDDTEVAPVATAPVVTPATTPEPIAQAAGITVADILGAPQNYLGQTWASSPQGVMVTEVPTDRGFWIEDNGNRIFAILNDGPAEQPVDINQGQRLMITEAVLRDRTFLPQIQGEPLDADTQRIAESQPIFLVVDEQNVTMLGSGM